MHVHNVRSTLTFPFIHAERWKDFLPVTLSLSFSFCSEKKFYSNDLTLYSTEVKYAILAVGISHYYNKVYQ